MTFSDWMRGLCARGIALVATLLLLTQPLPAVATTLKIATLAPDLDLFEEICGARLTYNYVRIGGVMADGNSIFDVSDDGIDLNVYNSGSGGTGADGREAGGRLASRTDCRPAR